THFAIHIKNNIARLCCVGLSQTYKCQTNTYYLPRTFTRTCISPSHTHTLQPHSPWSHGRAKDHKNTPCIVWGQHYLIIHTFEGEDKRGCLSFSPSLSLSRS